MAGLVVGGLESLVVLSQSSTGEYRALVVGGIIHCWACLWASGWAILGRSMEI